MCTCGSAFCDGLHNEVISQCAWCLKITSGLFEGTKLDYKISTASHDMCEECSPGYWIEQTVKRIVRISSSYLA
jgi:hypothetical protein